MKKLFADENAPNNLMDVSAKVHTSKTIIPDIVACQWFSGF